VVETASPLPQGTKGIDYFVTLQISGGVPPYSFLGPQAPPFPESAHSYQNHAYQTWTYVAPLSPNEIRVTFDARTEVESGYDYIYIRDGSGNNIPGSPFTGGELSGRTVTVPGSKVAITLRSDGSVTRWGFRVTSISPSHPGGRLPPGLALDSSDNLTGIPTQTGAYSFTVFVTDSQGRTVEKQFNVEFAEPLIITTARLNDGIVGRVYNQKLDATGGEGQLRWEVYSGMLPSGLSLDTQSEMLLGTPLEQTYGTIIFAVSDEGSRIVYKDFTLKVSEPLTLDVTSLPNALIDEPYSELIRF
jgi:hypothetical protein